ncbi:DUF1624 domain-containing protein [Methylobacterium haplocladii]|uniref:Heparan-alpha-glucosaminide N-acetyltransferase catalytic domain-containing protein n=1 Tax=Methylobacterium haplocladii TaxID=1176176 RepID=A0A512IKY5_9HYPH|nr:heparan-alpha-glucosaminide N-acetyltransferase [Methylobacterium haplocladii]GEO98298.1 hypothetical protein MHA02_06860 [Methylobacterium haplocladii]GJD84308.1 hypothetical protein HPGCJGGD_2184 [Methylobacterium haplocladii]GLS58408.1 hypothetical protein GCM10007887_10680 [Methylobacterium haplocladii]
MLDTSLTSKADTTSDDSRPLRIDAIDAARGTALLAMAAYHLTWDLGFLKVTPLNAALTPPGRLAAHLIAGSFLLLVGIGLVLATRNGLRWRPYLIRLARIGGAAILITGVTYWFMPDGFIFFGILHCIAVASILALPLLIMPAVIGIPASILASAVFVLGGTVLRHPMLEASELFFLGLGSRLPQTNDWVPLFPWFGIVLAGIALTRAGLPAFLRSRLARWRAEERVGRAATFAGRHSLAVYLVHQPVLFGLVYGLVSLTGPHPNAGVAEFRKEFQGNCTRTGGGPEACRIASRCVADGLRREGLWATGVTFTIEERARAQALSRQCYEAAEGTSPPP